MGPHGGEDGTVDGGNDFKKLVEQVLAFPQAEIPAPNICIEW
jgi:hypothetical protein